MDSYIDFLIARRMSVHKIKNVSIYNILCVMGGENQMAEEWGHLLHDRWYPQASMTVSHVSSWGHYFLPNNTDLYAVMDNL